VGSLNRLIENNIYFDPLTAMPNFFKFIEMDVKNTFGNQGSIMIFDMVKFLEINKNYGRETGDLFLKSFSFNLRSVLKEYENVLMFRTHGDEFTVIMQGMGRNSAEELAGYIKSEFRRVMQELGFMNADVHTLIFDYSNTINSIKDFYNIMFTESFKKLNSNPQKFGEEKFVDSIIGNFTNRIQETLALLNDAYNMALTDDISTLPNQRAAKIYLKHLMKETDEEKREFSILFIDGDNLRKYNQISYETGNEMIRALSQAIESSLRKNDRVFRWLSGDEFLVVLDKVNYDDGAKLAERIRISVEEETRNWLYPITVSIGIASYPEDGVCIQELISKAEKANAMAKNSGKNKVVRWIAG
jgi:diguanylate cyclase (GGDEF)-like protein